MFLHKFFALIIVCFASPSLVFMADSSRMVTRSFQKKIDARGAVTTTEQLAPQAKLFPTNSKNCAAPARATKVERLREAARSATQKILAAKMPSPSQLASSSASVFDETKEIDDSSKHLLSPDDKELRTYLIELSQLKRDSNYRNSIKNAVIAQLFLLLYMHIHIQKDNSFITISKKNDDITAGELYACLMLAFFSPNNTNNNLGPTALLCITSIITHQLEQFAYLPPLVPLELEQPRATATLSASTLALRPIAAIPEQSCSIVHALTPEEMAFKNLVDEALYNHKFYSTEQGRFADFTLILQTHPMALEYMLIINAKYIHKTLPLFTIMPSKMTKGFIERLESVFFGYLNANPNLAYILKEIFTRLSALTTAAEESKPFQPERSCMVFIKKILDVIETGDFAEILKQGQLKIAASTDDPS
jgi:hypothetical protein